MPINIKHFVIAFLIFTTGFSQVEEITPPDYIKTIYFNGGTSESQLPIIQLGETLLLEFDALNGDEEDYYYKIEHYNFDWTPSILVESEYIDGFDEQRIRDYDNSFNTLQTFSHYKLSIPNQFTKSIKITGNYLLTIYDDYDDVIFTRKFMVYQSQANVGLEIKRSRDVSTIAEKQSVDISISSGQLQFVNPKEAVKTVIIQNNNLKSAITDLKPQYILGNELSYRYNEASSFLGGNEFLSFENKEIRAANTGVQYIRLEDLYQTYLYTNTSRADLEYTYNPDLNGNFFINALNSDQPETEADYAWVHFALQYPKLEEGQTIHVYGNFNNYAIEPQTALEYYEGEDIYATAIQLKQGYYNYKYVIVDQDGTLQEHTIGGSFWQTENNYKVLVYYRALGARYDKIIGLGEANSVGITN
ncbi:type IX secretion system plug protein domain-containing protein [Olleya namhaensis]|uniref:type IX secretion system plug protein n=1 Tax=Olleya namhaensis TaxID=1144750 RepID=UPI00232E3D99|nr:type IX secretion system plug protein domain-containing protein [Olleya namhaensis]